MDRKVASCRVTVLGAGFLGAHVAEALLMRGRPVTVVSRSPLTEPVLLRLGGARILQGDAGDRTVLTNALEETGHVVIAFGGLLPAASNSNPLLDLELSLPPLLTILDAVCARPGIGLTYCSSGGTVYGEPRWLPVDENHPTEPHSAYGITKLASEKYVLLYRHAHGVPARVVRLSNLYGPGQQPDRGQGVIATFLQRVIDGRHATVLGDGSAIRDYLYVRDAADAIACLIDCSEAPIVLNVGSGKGTTLGELLCLIREVTGVSLPVQYQPRRSADIEGIVLNVSSLLDTLPGFQPTSLPQGLVWTWEAQRSQVCVSHRAQA